LPRWISTSATYGPFSPRCCPAGGSLSLLVGFWYNGTRQNGDIIIYIMGIFHSDISIMTSSSAQGGGGSFRIGNL